MERIQQMTLDFDFVQNGRIQHAATAFVGFEVNGRFKNDISIFHPKELIYFETLKFEKRKQDYYAGRLAAKLAVRKSCETFLKLDQIEIASGPLRQPLVKCKRADLASEVTLSHSEGLAAALASPTGIPFGLDVEKLSHEKVNLLKEEFREIKIPDFQISNGPDKEIIAWSLIESVSKAVKLGFSVPIETYEISSLRLRRDGSIGCTYKYLQEFQGQAWIVGSYIVSVTHLKSIDLQIPINLITSFILEGSLQEAV